MPKRVVYWIKDNEAWIFLFATTVASVCLMITIAVVWSQIQRTRDLASDSKALSIENKRLAKENRRLGEQNRLRLHEIQRNREISCRQIYGSYIEVFNPFFPPRPRQTPRQRAQLAKLKKLVIKFQNRCPEQISPP